MAQHTGEITMLDITDIATWDRSADRVIELLDSDLRTIRSNLCGTSLLDRVEAP